MFDQKIMEADEAYLALRDQERFREQRAFLEQLWERYSRYADKDFQLEITRQFHQRFWEMYLTVAFLDRGFTSLPKNKIGPDLCISNSDGRKLWIEAIAPGGGSGVDAAKVPTLGVADYIDTEKIILRLTSAFANKHQKYERYLIKGIIDHNEPCVIAINGWLIPNTDTDYDMPYIVQATLGFGDPYVIYGNDPLELLDYGYQFRSHATKMSGEQIDTGVFLTSSYSRISGVLFSTASALDSPSLFSKDFIFVHNPSARNPLERGWLRKGREYWLESKLVTKTWDL